HQICNSSATVKFLTTEPPLTRARSVLPAYMIDESDENPYYDDSIMKYMHRPLISEFENLTYPQYFEQYSITPSRPTTPRSIYRDQLQNYVVKRTKEIIIRYRYLTIEDGELYFYQQLLLNYPARSEADYKTTPDQTYRDKFLSLFPDFLNNLQTKLQPHTIHD
ncbi:1728_t:CDS:1, partial [Gigaspora rosea]